MGQKDDEVPTQLFKKSLEVFFQKLKKNYLLLRVETIVYQKKVI